MYWKKLNKGISVLVTITFLFNSTVYGAPSSRSLFKNKQVDYKKLSTQREEHLQKKQGVLREDEGGVERRREAKKQLLFNLEDLTQIHVPTELGRVIEVYQAEGSRLAAEGKRLVVHIQDLHTNPEGQLNLAGILELLIKDYGLGLVCSEGAEGVVDTSSVSSFPDYEVREKTARLFINSGELTGEEYLSITKYPDLPIWGIENRDIYFKNIIEFNKIMKFSPSAQVFISQAKKALEALKPKVYTKELREVDQKETQYEREEIKIEEYLGYILKESGLSAATPSNDGSSTRKGALSLRSIKLATTSDMGHRNVELFMETLEEEKKIDQAKVMNESQNLLLSLQTQLSKKNLRGEITGLMAKAQLFKEQKISPFSFYSYLKDLALRHIPDEISKYPALNKFVDYLAKVNSLDTTKLFNEMEDLTYEVKMKLAKTDEEKALTKALRNIKFLEGFFNLKISNEELDWYLANKESHKVGWFEAFLKPVLKRYNINSFVDFNPELIDEHLEELEEFYETVKKRDIAMIENAVSEIEKRDAKVAAFITGGFHTKGITRMLKDRGYSYIVVSPYSSTEIDEGNYHYLLSGKRKPISELLKELDNTLRVTLSSNHSLVAPYNKEVAPTIASMNNVGIEEAEIRLLEERALPVLLRTGFERMAAQKKGEPASRVALAFGEILRRYWKVSPYFVGHEVRLELGQDGEYRFAARLLQPQPEGEILVAIDEVGNEFNGPQARTIFKTAQYPIHSLKPGETRVAKAETLASQETLTPDRDRGAVRSALRSLAKSTQEQYLSHGFMDRPGFIKMRKEDERVSETTSDREIADFKLLNVIIPEGGGYRFRVRLTEDQLSYLPEILNSSSLVDALGDGRLTEKQIQEARSGIGRAAVRGIVKERSKYLAANRFVTRNPADMYDRYAKEFKLDGPTARREVDNFIYANTYGKFGSTTLIPEEAIRRIFVWRYVKGYDFVPFDFGGGGGEEESFKIKPGFITLVNSGEIEVRKMDSETGEWFLAAIGKGAPSKAQPWYERLAFDEFDFVNLYPMIGAVLEGIDEDGFMPKDPAQKALLEQIVRKGVPAHLKAHQEYRDPEAKPEDRRIVSASLKRQEMQYLYIFVLIMDLLKKEGGVLALAYTPFVGLVPGLTEEEINGSVMDHSEVVAGFFTTERLERPKMRLETAISEADAIPVEPWDIEIEIPRGITDDPKLRKVSIMVREIESREKPEGIRRLGEDGLGLLRKNFARAGVAVIPQGELESVTGISRAKVIRVSKELASLPEPETGRGKDVPGRVEEARVSVSDVEEEIGQLASKQDDAGRGKGSPLDLLKALIQLRNRGITSVTRQELINEYRKDFSESTIDEETRSLSRIGVINRTRGVYSLAEGFKDITEEDADRMNEAVKGVINKRSPKGEQLGLDYAKLFSLSTAELDAVTKVLKEAVSGTEAARIDLTEEEEEERIASMFQTAINGDKTAYQGIKGMSIEILIAYFEAKLPSIIENVPEDLFGGGLAYDVRGNAQPVPKERVDLTPENVYLIGKLLGSLHAKPGDKVLVTGDIRFHTPILRYSLLLGYASVGINVAFSEEELTTGAYNVYSADNPFKYRHQVQISGSHNPSAANGIKIKVDFGEGLLEPLYATRLYELYEKRNDIRSGVSFGRIEEVAGIQDAVIDMYDRTLPVIAKDEILVIDSRAGAAGPFVEKYFTRRGFKVVDMDVVNKENIDIVRLMQNLWQRGERRIVIALNMHADPAMSRGIWDPSKSEALVNSSALVKLINENRLPAMPKAIGGVFDGDADRITAIKEDGEAIPSFEMTLPYYQRFLLDPHVKAAIIEMVKAGDEPLWLACDVRSNNKLSELLNNINRMYQEEAGVKDKDFITGWMINTGYPPQLDFIKWRIREMNGFVNGQPGLSHDPEFMKNYEHLKRTYFTAEASGHNFFQIAPNNPYRPCDDGLAAFSVLVSLRETIRGIEAPALGIEQKDRYELTELFNRFPKAFSSEEVRVPVDNDIEVKTAISRRIGEWLRDKYKEELRPNSFAEPMKVEGTDLMCQPKDDGFVTVAGYKIQWQDGRSALIRWSNTSARLTMIFTGFNWDSCAAIMEEVKGLLQQENLDVKDIEDKIRLVKKEAQRFAAAGPQTLASSQTLSADEVAKGIVSKSTDIWQHVVDEDGNSMAGDIVRWLGWVDAPERFSKRMAEVRELRQILQKEGITNVVVLGTGGSGLSIKNDGQIYERKNLRVVELEDPQEIRNVIAWLDDDERGWENTIFVVQSKSWGTTETRNAEAVFREEGEKKLGSREAVAQHFVAVTDEDKIKGEEKRNFRQMDEKTYAIFINNWKNDAELGLDIGGRNSSASFFNLVAAELAGIPYQDLLDGEEAEYKDFEKQGGQYIGVQIGELLNKYRLKGRNKITFILDDELEPFGPWVQQEINESLGKIEDCVVCVTGEEYSKELVTAGVYGNDRVFVRISIEEGDALDVAEQDGFHFINLRVNNKYEIDKLRYRFKVATAVLGHRMGVHPFNQPAVEGSKKITKAILDPSLTREQLTQRLNAKASEGIKKTQDGLSIYYKGRTEEALGIDAGASDAEDILRAFLGTVKEGDYVYLSPYTYDNPELQSVFSDIRAAIRDRHAAHPATLFGIGSRCQHSDNQLNNATDKAAVVVFTFDTAEGVDRSVPGRNYTLSQENMAHALGTVGALEDEGRRVLRIHLSNDYRENPAKIKELFENALQARATQAFTEQPATEPLASMGTLAEVPAGVNPFLLFEEGRDRGNTTIDENTVVIGTGGGDCAGLSGVTAGVVEGADTMGLRVVGIRHCYDGMVDPDFGKKKTELTPLISSRMKGLPGTVLASCRRNLSPEDIDLIIERFKDARALIITGGNDHIKQAEKIHRRAQERGIDMLIICVPKSIDNDFRTAMLGAWSAVLLGRQIVSRAAVDPDKSDGRTAALFEVMGRKSGSLTLEISKGCPYPKAVLTPEFPVTIAQIKEMADRGVRNFFGSEGFSLSENDPQRQELLNAYPVLMRMWDKATDPVKMELDVHGNPKLTGASLFVEGILRHFCGLEVERTDLTFEGRGISPQRDADEEEPFDTVLAGYFAEAAKGLIGTKKSGFYVLTYPDYEDRGIEAVEVKTSGEEVYAAKDLKSTMSNKELAGLGVLGVEGYSVPLQTPYVPVAETTLSVVEEARRLFYATAISAFAHERASVVELREPPEVIIDACDMKDADLEVLPDDLRTVVEATRDSVMVLTPKVDYNFSVIAKMIRGVYSRLGYVNIAVSKDFRIHRDDPLFREVLDKDPILRAKFEKEALDSGDGFVRFDSGVSNFINGLFKHLKIQGRVTNLGYALKGLTSTQAQAPSSGFGGFTTLASGEGYSYTVPELVSFERGLLSEEWGSVSAIDLDKLARSMLDSDPIIRDVAAKKVTPRLPAHNRREVLRLVRQYAARKQEVDRMNQIKFVAAEKIKRDKPGFIRWLANEVPQDHTVIVIAMDVDEYREVEDLSDLVHIKVVKEKGKVDKRKFAKELGIKEYQVLNLDEEERHALDSILVAYDDFKNLDLGKVRPMTDIERSVVRAISAGV